jgi:ketosteroid isomerase-like protein
MRFAVAALGAVLSWPALGADAANPGRDAEAVVRAFNAEFGKKDVEALASHVIEGGVKFDLKPAHADQTAALTQEIKAHWYGVTPILFAATESYVRSVEIVETRAAPDMATVWTRVTTDMRMPKTDKSSKNTFNEVYFLVRTKQGWKIGAMMDDRATDKLVTATPPK